MKDPEVEILIAQLETRDDLTVAEFDGITRAFAFLLPGAVPGDGKVRVEGTDAALHLADVAFPDWTVNIHGRANERDGHWRCSLRESDQRDSDAAIGMGRSPVLSQAILAAVMRLALTLKKA